MRAFELRDQLWDLWPGLNREKTVDQVIAGDPNQPILGVAVCWMPYSWTLREAASRGANLVVAHEPTFYDHFEFRQQLGAEPYLRAKEKKQRLIEELCLTVIRCHDVWDAYQPDGVPWQWAKFLGLDDLVNRDTYAQVHRVPEQTALEFAQYVASRTAAAGQGTVGFYGDPERRIRTVGIGTGCYSEALKLYELGADLALSVDDIARAWVIGEYCTDTGSPMVVINHGVSEACAMESLAETVRSILPETPVTVVRQGCSYLEVSASP